MHLSPGLLTALVIITTLPAYSQAGQPGTNDTLQTPVIFFPSSTIFPRLYADGTTHQFGVSKDLSSALIYGSIGNHITLLEARAGGTAIQFSAGGTVLASIIKRPRLLQVVTVDFLVEFPIDIRLNERFALRSGYGHFSAHYADDGIEILGRSSVNYAKDYLMLLGCWHVPVLRADVYAGGHWDYHSLPEESSHWTVQAGVEGGDVQLFPEGCAYAAVDVQWKSEVTWATTQSYHFGVKLFPRGGRVLRIAYTHRTGIDDRGQFFQERSASHRVGVYLDF
jgi:hypothetical protein